MSELPQRFPPPPPTRQPSADEDRFSFFSRFGRDDAPGAAPRRRSKRTSTSLPPQRDADAPDADRGGGASRAAEGVLRWAGAVASSVSSAASAATERGGAGGGAPPSGERASTAGAGAGAGGAIGLLRSVSAVADRAASAVRGGGGDDAGGAAVSVSPDDTAMTTEDAELFASAL